MRAGSVSAQSSQPKLKFDFGPGRVASGYTQVLAGTIYTRELGYGFEPGAVARDDE